MQSLLGVEAMFSPSQNILIRIINAYISVVGFGPKSHYRDLIGRTALGLGCGV